MTTYTVTISSPIGPIVLASNGEALTGIYMERPPAELADVALGGEARAPVLRSATAQLRAYFARELTEFDLPLAPHGTDFQCKVWRELRRIPYGKTASYGELARRVGNEKASRAVGLANGRNPLSIVVPCHRVIGSNGKLTGYAGGLDRKRYLLDLESSTLVAPSALV